MFATSICWGQGRRHDGRKESFNLLTAPQNICPICLFAIVYISFRQLLVTTCQIM